MDEFETSHDVLSSLTPDQAAVLRKRFGISMRDAEDNKSVDSAIPPPSGSDEDGGSGGSAPASPLFE